jgi:hypothetical protein
LHYLKTILRINLSTFDHNRIPMCLFVMRVNVIHDHLVGRYNGTSFVLSHYQEVNTNLMRKFQNYDILPLQANI